MPTMIIAQGKFGDMLNSISMDIRHKARTSKLSKTLRFALRRMTSSDVFHSERLYIVSQQFDTATLPHVSPPKIPVTFRQATPADIPLFSQLDSIPSGVEAKVRSIERGDVVTLALHNERLVGTAAASIYRDGWHKSRPVPEADAVAIARVFPVNSAVAYNHMLLVAEDMRGKGIAQSLLQQHRQALSSQGVRQIFGAVWMDNESLISTAYRAGARPVGILRSFQFIQWLLINIAILKAGDDPLAAQYGKR